MDRYGYLAALSLGAMAACGTSTRGTDDSDAAGGPGKGSGGDSGTGGQSGASTTGGVGGETTSVGGAGGGTSGSDAGGTPSAVGGTPSAVGGTPSAVGGTPSAVGGTPSAVGGTPMAVGGTPSWTVNDPPKCAPSVMPVPCQQLDGCPPMFNVTLGCTGLATIDLAATGPTDAYLVAEAQGRVGHIELPMTLLELFVIERHGDEISVAPGPFDDGKCRIQTHGDDLLLACLGTQGLGFARRVDGAWQTETLESSATGLELLAFEVAPDGTVYVATGAPATGIRRLYVQAPGGEFNADDIVAQSYETAAMALDSEAEPVWAVWAKPDFYRLSFTGADGVPLELVSTGSEPGRVSLWAQGNAQGPFIVTELEEQNIGFVPTEDGFAKVELSAPSTSTSDCPTEAERCSLVEHTCRSAYEEYSLPLLTASETRGTLLAYTHTSTTTTDVIYDCTDTCLCTTLPDYTSSAEFVLAKAPVAGESAPAIITRLRDTLSVPSRMVATGDTLHLVSGGAYVTLDLTGL